MYKLKLDKSKLSLIFSHPNYKKDSVFTISASEYWAHSLDEFGDTGEIKITQEEALYLPSSYIRNRNDTETVGKIK